MQQNCRAQTVSDPETGDAVRPPAPGLTLHRPGPALAADFLALAREFVRAGEDAWLQRDGFDQDDFPRFVQRLEGEALAGQRQTFWVTDGTPGELLGVTSLQPDIAALQLPWCGHIAFRVRPSRRRRGVGTQALGLTLDRAAEVGLQEVRLVCLSDNQPARRVIQRHGGRHVSDAVWEGLTVQQYEVRTDRARLTAWP